MYVDALCTVLEGYPKVKHKMKFLNNSGRLMTESRITLKGRGDILPPPPTGDTWSQQETFLVGTTEGEGLLLQSTG